MNGTAATALQTLNYLAADFKSGIVSPDRIRAMLVLILAAMPEVNDKDRLLADMMQAWR